LIEVVLNIRIPELWVTPITEKYNAIVSCKIGGHSSTAGWGIVTVKGDENTIDKILEEIKQHPSVGGIEIKNREQGLASFVVNIVRCKACEVLIRSKAFMVFPVDIQKGRMKWLLITDNNKTIGKISDKLEECGCNVKIDRVTLLSEKGILTERQEEIIRLAFSVGYFDFPRRIGSLKLANKLGISISTLSEIMRTAQRRIFAEYLKT
jgi:predicted DNA binding protein